MFFKWIVFVFLLITLFSNTAFSEEGVSKNGFTFVAVEIEEKVNIWLPSAIVVKKGEVIHLLIRNVSERDHGFTIDGLGVKELIPPEGKIRVKINAASEGIYSLYCHLHKAHIGGQILVQ